MIERGRAAGVVLEDGAVVRASAVISGADYRHTMSDLLPADVAARAAAAEAAAGRPQPPLTSSNFTVFLGVRRDAVDLSAFRGHQLLVKLEEGAPVPWAEKEAAGRGSPPRRDMALLVVASRRFRALWHRPAARPWCSR